MGLRSTRERDEQVRVLAGLIHQLLEDAVVSIKQEVWENNVKPEERRNVISGTFKYLGELDSLATEGQYGKFSVRI